MSFLPGWDSINSTETIAHYLHVTAVVVLGLLFVAEGMALIYDFRNHRLIKTAESVREIAQKEKEDAAEGRRKAEVEGLEKKLTEADKKLSEVQQNQTARRLKDEQKRAIIDAVKPFSGHKFLMVTVASNPEAFQYATDFVQALREAGWDDGSKNITTEITFGGPDPVGVEIIVNSAYRTAGAPPAAAAALIKVLGSLQIMTMRIGADPAVPLDTIKVVVGAKPATP